MEGKKKDQRALAKNKRRTPRQARFFREFVDPSGEGFGNATICAGKAGYAGAPGSVQLAVQGSRVLHHPAMQDAIAAALAAQGFSAEFAAGLLLRAMNAKTVKVVSIGKQQRLVEGVDHRIQVKALEVTLRLFPTIAKLNDASGRDNSTRERVSSPSRDEAIQTAQGLLLEFLDSAEIVRLIQRLQDRLRELAEGSVTEPAIVDTSTSSNANPGKSEDSNA